MNGSVLAVARGLWLAVRSGSAGRRSLRDKRLVKSCLFHVSSPGQVPLSLCITLQSICGPASPLLCCVQVRFSVETINQDPPATCGADVVSSVEAAVKELGLSSKHMVSRAYHDSL